MRGDVFVVVCQWDGVEEVTARRLPSILNPRELADMTCQLPRYTLNAIILF